MGLIQRIFGGKADPSAALLPLYEQVVARARAPHWYEEGAVPDTIDGRFDMIAAVLSLVLLRLEPEEKARRESVWLTELFVADMDGQLRQIGIGDVSVGKHMGKMMSALGGRLGAYRLALPNGGTLGAAIRRNIFREEPAPDAGVAHVAREMRLHADALAGLFTDALLSGRAHW
ncbi:ubiquinol-cytochrome C chaperone family protein [Novosphingopyxis sp.]|uniref:ubiquinol-cytochrome C chaperone family protein n=1 Tax=Novosphingopyxis sp. TaxID=2709690 RepID=UPI003B599A83